WAAITERRLDVDEPLRKWLEGPPPHGIPPRRTHGERGAVGAPPSGEDPVLRSLPLELPVLARGLYRGLGWRRSPPRGKRSGSTHRARAWRSSGPPRSWEEKPAIPTDWGRSRGVVQ